MRTKKLNHLNITCPRCGCKIELSIEEYLKYLKVTEYYGVGEVICMDSVPGEADKVDTTHVNLPCPICDHYIALNFNELDADSYGFCLPQGVEAVYDPPTDMSIEEYITEKYEIPPEEQGK